MENKCSEENECQNPETRWIRAAGTNTDQCPIISISPERFDLDAPEIVKKSAVQFIVPIGCDLNCFVSTADTESVSASPSFAGE